MHKETNCAEPKDDRLSEPSLEEDDKIYTIAEQMPRLRGM